MRRQPGRHHGQVGAAESFLAFHYSDFKLFSPSLTPSREELMAAATVAVLLGVPIIGLVSLLSPVPTTCLDPPAVEGVKFHAVVPSTFYAYSPYFNDTSEGIVNPTGLYKFG